jgi:hypothetical protein
VGHYGIGQHLWRTTSDVDAVQFAGSKKADRAAIARPKGELRALGSQQRLRFHKIEPPQPQSLGSLTSDKHEGAAVGRQRKMER